MGQRDTAATDRYWPEFMQPSASEGVASALMKE
jgi:hypothetical protein